MNGLLVVMPALFFLATSHANADCDCDCSLFPAFQRNSSYEGINQSVQINAYRFKNQSLVRES